MKDSVQLVLDLLRERLDGAGAFKSFYDGDPDLIPTMNLPALVVTKTSDTSEPATQDQDDVTDTIVVKAILNKADDWGNDRAKTKELTEAKLRRWMEERDPVTRRWKPTTIKGALRQGLDGDRRIGQRMSLEIGVTPRPGDLVTHEAHLTITVEYIVNVDLNIQ